MNAWVTKYMMSKLDPQYYGKFRHYYNLISGFYGKNVTTNFEDAEKLKLITYLTINSYE